MSQLDFDSVFTQISTEKTLKGQEDKKFLTFYTAKHIRKNLAKFLFNKKFNVYPLGVNSCSFKKAINVRTKARREVKYKILKKFYFKLPENFKMEE